MKILSLLCEDQQNIQDFFSRKISKEAFQQKSACISEKFLHHIERNGFPHPSDNDHYKAAITLSLHLEPKQLNHISTIYKDIIETKDQCFFEDKIRISKGKKQKWGTQFMREDNGNIILLPVIDENNLDERRLSRGLSTIEEYLRYAQEQ
jgi:hypothetical protein